MLSLSEEYKKRLMKLSGILSENDISTWASSVQKELGLHSFDVWMTNKGDIKLQGLVVPKENRKQGIGSQAMKKLIDYADSVKKRIVLTPGLANDYHGTTSRGRLVAFYKQFGFIENKGRYKDFTISDGMYRNPRK